MNDDAFTPPQLSEVGSTPDCSRPENVALPVKLLIRQEVLDISRPGDAMLRSCHACQRQRTQGGR